VVEAGAVIAVLEDVMARSATASKRSLAQARNIGRTRRNR
jgi:hypothetical protein